MTYNVFGGTLNPTLLLLEEQPLDFYELDVLPATQALKTKHY